MKKIILVLILLFTFNNLGFASNEKDVIGVEIIKDPMGSINIKNVYFTKGYQTRDQIETKYYLSTLDSNKKILSQVKFNLEEFVEEPLQSWFDENGNQIYFPEYKPQLIDRTIFINFDSEVKFISIVDKNQKLISLVNITEYTGTIEIIALENTPQSNNTNENYISKIILILVIIVVIIILTILVIKKINKNKKDLIIIKNYISNELYKGYSLEQIKTNLINEGIDNKIIENAIKELNLK